MYYIYLSLCPFILSGAPGGLAESRGIEYIRSNQGVICDSPLVKTHACMYVLLFMLTCDSDKLEISAACSVYVSHHLFAYDYIFDKLLAPRCLFSSYSCYIVEP